MPPCQRHPRLPAHSTNACRPIASSGGHSRARSGAVRPSNSARVTSARSAGPPSRTARATGAHSAPLSARLAASAASARRAMAAGSPLGVRALTA